MLVGTILLVLWLRVNFLTSTLLFFGLPSAYLLWRKPKDIKKTVAASLIFGLLFGFILDFVAEFNHAWSWPDVSGLVFSYKLLGLVPIDVMIWYVLWVFSIVVFYEHFIERNDPDRISPNYRRALYPALTAIAMLVLLFITNQEVFEIRNAYLVVGLGSLLPFLVFMLEDPTLFEKFWKVSLYFFLLYLSFEVTALKLNQWSFPGEYIGTVSLFEVTFPVEELVFWMLLSSTIVLSYYHHWIEEPARSSAK